MADEKRFTEDLNALVPNGQTCESDRGREVLVHQERRGVGPERSEDTEDGRDGPDRLERNFEQVVPSKLREFRVT